MSAKGTTDVSTLDLEAPATPTALSVTHDDGVATVRLERPGAANALDRTLWRELRDTFRALDAEPGVRVVVLAGAGKHFCSGIDLSMLGEIQGMAPDGADPGRAREALRRLILDLQDVLTTVERCRVPVLAAIQGVCVGAGLDLAVACDLRYATPRTKFSLKEVDMGLAADVGVLQRLPRIVGEGRAREMAYTCRDVRGSEAETMGPGQRLRRERRPRGPGRPRPGDRPRTGREVAAGDARHEARDHLRPRPLGGRRPGPDRDVERLGADLRRPHRGRHRLQPGPRAPLRRLTPTRHLPVQAVRPRLQSDTARR
jgi:enoyl-CoA hydratase/carnithine racemase